MILPMYSCALCLFYILYEYYKIENCLYVPDVGYYIELY